MCVHLFIGQGAILGDLGWCRKRQRALQKYGRTGELRDRLSDWRFDGWAGCRTHGETDKLTSMDVCIDEQLDH